MKKIGFMDVSFRDGLELAFGTQVRSAALLPALEAATAAGTRCFEVGLGAHFQNPCAACPVDAFASLDACRAAVGPEVSLQTLAYGTCVVGAAPQPSDIIKLHAVLTKKHGISIIRNLDALNDLRNLDYSGRCLVDAGLQHQIAIALLGLPPNLDAPVHSAAYYVDRLREILRAGIPFHSLAFEDASGTCTPRVVFDTIKQARQLLPADTAIQFRTQDTAGLGIACTLAAIEGGAEIIDLAMAPLSGGNGAPDLLTLWHVLKGSDFTLDIDCEKVLKAEAALVACLDGDGVPPADRGTDPLPTLAPMPDGACPADPRTRREQRRRERLPLVVSALRDVVARSGFGTFSSPVGQLYVQQAANNAQLGPWTRIADGYGRLILGYFGRTPVPPDAEIVALAAAQLGLAATAEDPRLLSDANADLGVQAAIRKLEAAGLPISDESILIVASGGEGARDTDTGPRQDDQPHAISRTDAQDLEPTGEAVQAAPAAAAAAPSDTGPVVPAAAAAEAPPEQPTVVAPADQGPSTYDVTVNGVTYRVQVAPVTAGTAPQITRIEPQPTAVGAEQPAVGGEIRAPLPGVVVRLLALVGAGAKEGDPLLTLEAVGMEQEIRSTLDGTVLAVKVAVGDRVDTDQVLMIVG